ncbi:hypothetical protein KFE25_000772 [Diacronema lutheri]|uniref:Nucleotide-diphospho-sugar transferase domain-containing protein n=1 Tax=Diacronema lutheri TaxID=2081491 RepID=A0A8J5XER8_DIALT|nr:hypothetical protein KFE25_000772 [Diacronema lutheri]
MGSGAAEEEGEPLIQSASSTDSTARRSRAALVRILIRVCVCCCCCGGGGGIAALVAARAARTSQPCSRRAFAFATLLTHRVGAKGASPCYRAAVAILLRSWLATRSRYPFLLLHTADLDAGMRALVDERPGAVVPIRTEQIEQPGASEGDLGAMATKLNLWTLGGAGGYEQIAYFDGDHVFLSNADAIFEACGCGQPFCGVWDPRMPEHRFLRTFGEPSSGNHTRRLVNAGTLVIQPDVSLASSLRQRWASRAEFMSEDLDMVATGSDQTFFNHMMGEHFRTVDQGFNLMHVGRSALAAPDGSRFVRFLHANGTAFDPATPTVVHLKAWTRGRARLEQAVHGALRARFIQPDPYVSELVRDPQCDPDRARPRNSHGARGNAQRRRLRAG